ncbi:hypothetical protein [Embleya sp. NBC_00896]|uniref:hypothetical protein n=1 Tax=Embleya sp. NBC_00896 TaxID=2975961 RepID=UPI00386CCA46|nr:hypothetical protein OG928_27330 [Embleya sp. NBC_00896]
MTAANPTLAALLDGPDAEPADLLAAIVESGVVIPIDDTESVVFIRGQDGLPWLPAFVDEATCARDVPHAQPYLCDAPRLLDIAARTGVRTLTVASATQCATVPMALIAKASSTLDRPLPPDGTD